MNVEVINRTPVAFWISNDHGVIPSDGKTHSIDVCDMNEDELNLIIESSFHVAAYDEFVPVDFLRKAMSVSSSRERLQEETPEWEAACFDRWDFIE